MKSVDRETARILEEEALAAEEVKNFFPEWDYGIRRYLAEKQAYLAYTSGKRVIH